MDINSYETLKVVETMREYGAPYTALSAATDLPESKLKAYCRREDTGICWMQVCMSILRREDTGRTFSMESILEKETMQFCRSKNISFWREAECCGCIPQMVEDILNRDSVDDAPITCIFDLRRYSADRKLFFASNDGNVCKMAQLLLNGHIIPRQARLMVA